MLNLYLLVSPTRFERAAHRLGICCSILLSYGDEFIFFYTLYTMLLQHNRICMLKTSGAKTPSQPGAFCFLGETPIQP